MLSVIIPTHNSERPLFQTLAALVPAAATGTVREVIVTDANSSDATLEVADIAGCTVADTLGTLAARLHGAAGRARSDWLMFMRPGMILEPAWAEEVAQFIQQVELADSAQRAASFRLTSRVGAHASPFLEALRLLRLSLTRQHDPSQGLLIARRHYERIGGHRASNTPEEDLLRRLGRRNVLPLRSGATFAA
jgi:glycosyltransferase involved in cell wall biosynthesis